MLKFLVKAAVYGGASYLIARKLDQMKAAERVNVLAQPFRQRVATVMANLSRLTVPGNVTNGQETSK